VNIYRRHNPTRCNSTNPLACQDKRRPCPIWIRGNAPSGEYVEKSLKTRDWAKAADALKRWEESGKAPKTASRTTVEQWRDSYLKLAEMNNLSGETLRKYRHLFAQLMKFTEEKGVRYVDEFDLPLTTEFRLSWSDGALSTSKKLERLRSIMRFAVEREWLIKNPALSLKAPKVKPNPTLPFSKDEIARIINAARSNQRVCTFIVVMRSSGLRISDVTKLAVNELKGNRLALHQAKTGEHVSILLDPSVADALRAVVKLNRSPKYFFWTGESKLPGAVSNWRRRIARVFKDAGIVNGHSHRFRDSFAVALLEKGASLESVSRLLGHTSIRITERHYNPWVKSRQAALDAEVEGADGWLKEIEAPKTGKVVQIGKK
jgi:integrase/recombinase XerD